MQVAIERVLVVHRRAGLRQTVRMTDVHLQLSVSTCRCGDLTISVVFLDRALASAQRFMPRGNLTYRVLRHNTCSFEQLFCGAVRIDDKIDMQFIQFIVRFRVNVLQT